MLEEANRKKTQRRKGRKAVRALPILFLPHTYFKHKLLNVIMQRKTKERGRVPRANVSEYSQEGRNSKERNASSDASQHIVKLRQQELRQKKENEWNRKSKQKTKANLCPG